MIWHAIFNTGRFAKRLTLYTRTVFVNLLNSVQFPENNDEVNFMSEKHPECPLYNPLNCKEYYNPKICAFVRKDKVCLKKKKPKTKAKVKA